MSEVEAAVRERPILFSGEMVRAILDGRKTQTRRVVKPVLNPDKDWPGGWQYGVDGPGTARKIDADYPDDESDMIRCPYGQPGDRLYVRETWYQAFKPGPRPGQHGVIYLADGPDFIPSASERARHGHNWGRSEANWKPSIHMPKKYARTWLEVTAVRVERVQDICELECYEEGISPAITTDPDKHNERVREDFHALWDSINAKRGFSWDSNPWVWVVEFRRVEP